jgi:hypothetical protein
MASDIEKSLIDGGLTPAAAKVIANALGNVATGRTNIGRQLADATPADRMRMVDADTRRYLLTNLDYPTDDPFRSRIRNTASQFTPRTSPHPYQDSQPASANPTLSTPNVSGGPFVSVSTSTANEVAQAGVTLNVKNAGGQHARLNPATGEVEAVPIRVEIEPQGFMEGAVEETPQGTVIKLRLIHPMFANQVKVWLTDGTGATVGARRINATNNGPAGPFLFLYGWTDD